MKSKRKLTIIIGTYNRLESLKQCLDSLIGKLKVEHEIIVADAGSTDGTLEYLQGLPEVRLVCDNARIGQAQSFNRILDSVSGDDVCWLSDDNVVQGGMLDLAVSILDKDASIGMVTLKVKDMTGPYVDAPYIGGIWESGILNCNQGVLSASLLRRLGGFSEEFRDYGIDIDLTTRVLLAGYRVVYTKRVAIHHYRDHESTNWASKQERKRRADRGKDLYRHMYPFLLEQDDTSKNIFVSLFMGFHRLCQILSRFFPGSWINSLTRDTANMISAKFISKWDLLITLFRPYYLMQQIPHETRAKWNLQDVSWR